MRSNSHDVARTFEFWLAYPDWTPPGTTLPSESEQKDKLAVEIVAVFNAYADLEAHKRLPDPYTFVRALLNLPEFRVDLSPCCKLRSRYSESGNYGVVFKVVRCEKTTV